MLYTGKFKEYHLFIDYFLVHWDYADEPKQMNLIRLMVMY